MSSLLRILIFGLISFCSASISHEEVENSQFPPQAWAQNEPFIFEDKGILTQEEADADAELFEDLPRVIAEPGGPDFRLPTDLIPSGYILQIRPIIDGNYPGIGEKDTAPGVVYITMECVNPTNRIVMHSKFLQINESSIQVIVEDENVNVSSVEYDIPRDFLIINLESELKNDTNFFISMHFIANVPTNDSLRGLYSESYLDPLTNRTKIMAATQLEPLRARQVFPCFDEPTYKTPFLVSIGRTENFTSLSNAPFMGAFEDPDGNPGWYFDSFNYTVPMPTYLLALAVSEYDYNEASSDLYRLPVKVHGPKHLVGAGRGNLTANGSAQLMSTFEKMFGIPYNMLKLDSISVPNKRGAMENYGLITYGENFLMYYNGTTTSTELRTMHNILAHELAHQWFGNLVTCKWWSDIWLNEGFATYMSYVGQHELWPEYDMITHMLSSVNSALQYDAGPSSHPMHQEAYDALQIGTNMDTIGYDKGASIVRLMESFLGKDVFYNGLTKYLLEYYDNVAEQDDLFRILNESARDGGLELPKNVTNIMNTWTLQKGFPLVRVSQTGSELTISQEPWENADVRNDTSNPGTSWDIPVKYLVESDQASGQLGSFWLLKEEKSKEIPVQNGNGWILTNPDAGGYYRTLYDDELTSRITNQLLRNHSVFSADARVRLIDDQLNLGLQQYVPIQSALEFTKYLVNETDPTVWHVVFNNLEKVKNFYRNLRANLETEDIAAFEASLGQSIGSLLYSIPEEVHDTPSSMAILRSQLLEWTCQMNFVWCDVTAGVLISRWKMDPSKNPIPTDIQSTFYCKIVERSNFFEGFEWMTEQYFKTDDPVQRTRISTALGCSTSIRNITAVIDMILHPTGDRKIEKAHSIAVFQQLMTFSELAPYTLAHLFHSQPGEIPNYYDGDLSSVIEILSAVTPHYANESYLNIIRSIKDANPEFYKDSLDPTISTIEQNMKWLEVFRSNITSWFKENPQVYNF